MTCPSSCEGAVKMESYKQQHELGGHRYVLIVGRSAPLGIWEWGATKDGKAACVGIRPRREFDNLSDEERAKREAHLWAYSDAGMSNHVCNDSCKQWDPL